MTRRSEPPRQPTVIGRRGIRGSYDPFYAFEQIAREGNAQRHPPKPPRGLLIIQALLSSKAALVLAFCVLLFVIATLIALLIARA